MAKDDLKSVATDRHTLVSIRKNSDIDAEVAVLTVFNRPILAVQDVVNPSGDATRGWYVELDTPAGRSAALAVARGIAEALKQYPEV